MLENINEQDGSPSPREPPCPSWERVDTDRKAESRLRDFSQLLRRYICPEPVDAELPRESTLEHACLRGDPCGEGHSAWVDRSSEVCIRVPERLPEDLKVCRMSKKTAGPWWAGEERVRS